MTAPGRIVLAPMEGVADDILRDALTQIGGFDWCVTEFVRVQDLPVPEKVFRHFCPELLNAAKTPAGTPVRVQLLGSDPDSLAFNAAGLAAMKPWGIDLNFGCPAKTVNRHRGGAALLGEPQLLHDILRAVRAAVPPSMMVTAKMRLGILDPDLAIDCAQALATGGAQELVVHARTKADAYRPPARWSWLQRIRDAVSIPVIGNGDVFTVADYHRLRDTTGCVDVMIGRGAVSDPFLAQRILGQRGFDPSPEDWEELKPRVGWFWRQVYARHADNPKRAAGRLKMWLNPLRRTFAAAELLFQTIRMVDDAVEIERVLAQQLGAAHAPALSMGA